ncbi:hypothetical protein GCM10009535_32840 [Streptomyces thermocarboxydovorans]|uniref:YcaO domain-containing protein n=1 Tax=Streptomyces thermocarboxydovorans TaxID=59298 RepID=A0ABP3SPW3_9ACTN
MEEYSPRSNVVLAPPEDHPAARQANLETLRDALERSFPDVFVEFTTSSLRDVPVMNFEIEAEQGVFVTGTAAMPTPDHAHAALIDATAHTAALFAHWLRDTYVPSPAGVRFLSTYTAENGDKTARLLPATGDAAQNEAILRTCLPAAGDEDQTRPAGLPEHPHRCRD